MRPFRFGVISFGAPSRAAWEERARRAEALGYATLLMADHIDNPWPPVPALAFAAAVTSTLRIGCTVFCNDFRHPAILAKDAAAIDVLSDGRFEFGLGAGWAKQEYEGAGLRFDTPGTRIGRMAESLQVVKGLWGDDPFTFAGGSYAITDLNGTPKQVQRPHPPRTVDHATREVRDLLHHDYRR